MVLKDIPQNVWSLGLDRVRQALDRLDHPERFYRHVLVAGTNGKGSTCVYLERILMTQGVSVGTTISPHVTDFTERFRICGRNADSDALAKLRREIEPAVKDIPLTYFEWCVILAACLFRQNSLDFGIFEVGLGGRYDAANVLDPEVSLITDIALDHTQYLGSTVSEIAGEKARIARRGRPLITTAAGAALETVQEHASAVGAVLHVVDKPCGYRTSMKGSRQALNAALALRTAHVLGFRPSGAQISYALSTAFLPGRIEEIGGRVVLDVAHNPSAMGVLLEYLENSGFHGVGVLGVLADKDYISMTDMLKSICTRVYIAPVQSERSWGPSEMERCLDGGRVVQRDSISRAFDEALATGEKVVVTGSFYTVGEIRESIVCTGS